jgi:DNA repair protein RecN (Recombination protein N)
MDEVEFFFAANPGEARRSLSDVASGGEASRVLLALKRAAAQSDPCSCYVLDEADGGLGGAAAEVVGRMIKDVSADHQVLCVTHLAQVAAYADQHLLVVKRERAGRSCSTVVPLEDRQARARELARILSGIDVSREAIGAAEALMRSAVRAGRARSRSRPAASGSSGKLRQSA